jgi:hypothetical protein
MLNETIELVDLGDKDVIDLIEGREDAGDEGDEEHDHDDSHRSSHSPTASSPLQHRVLSEATVAKKLRVLGKSPEPTFRILWSLI